LKSKLFLEKERRGTLGMISNQKKKNEEKNEIPTAIAKSRSKSKTVPKKERE
jgi:hypothetical protein